MQIFGRGNGKKMPKFNFGEMDGVKCPNSIGRNGRNLMSKSDLDGKEEKKCSQLCYEH